MRMAKYITYIWYINYENYESIELQQSHCKTTVPITSVNVFDEQWQENLPVLESRSSCFFVVVFLIGTCLVSCCIGQVLFQT